MPRLVRFTTLSVLSLSLAGVLAGVLVSAPAAGQSTSSLRPGCTAPLRRGRWQSSNGNFFWIQCVGGDVFWLGMNRQRDSVREGERWTQVGHGTVHGNLIDLVWSDIPYGVITTYGRIQLKLEADTLLVVVRDDGLFDEPRLHWVAKK